MERIQTARPVYRACIGNWPSVWAEGPATEVPKGGRSLTGGSSLPKLLAEHRGMRNRANLAQLSNEQILIWADSHRKRTGQWPNPTSGALLFLPESAVIPTMMSTEDAFRVVLSGGVIVPERLGLRPTGSPGPARPADETA